ncbi:MAG: cupin [Hyphomonadaceae bacterium]|nr:cupin [Hyphomonadaceae bacterium]
MPVYDLSTEFLHLGLGATAVPQPPFSGMDWYGDYGARHDHDGADGRLVSLYSFSSSWDSWEMHPQGHEVVVCLAGRLRLIQEHVDGRVETLELGPKQYAINAPGVWHTADVDGEVTALFITAGIGTQHRPR